MIWSLPGFSSITLILFFVVLVMLFCHYSVELAMLIAHDRLADAKLRFAAVSSLPPERLRWAGRLIRFASYLVVLTVVIDTLDIVGHAQIGELGHAAASFARLLDRFFWVIYGFYVALFCAAFVARFDQLRQPFALPRRPVTRLSHRPTRLEIKAKRAAQIAAEQEQRRLRRSTGR